MGSVIGCCQPKRETALLKPWVELLLDSQPLPLPFPVNTMTVALGVL